MRKNQCLQFIELNDKKRKREIEGLFLKPIIVFLDDMDSFEIKKNEEYKTS